MFAEFLNTLRKLRGSIIGWSIGLVLYDLLMSSFYSSIMEMGDEMVAMLENYPPEMMAFFPSIAEFTSPVGYIDTYFSSMMTLIVGIFVVGIFAKLVVGDEEKGTLDLVISYPISRSSLFWGRVLGALSAIILVLVAAWLGWVFPAESSGFTLTAWEFLLPMLPLLSVLLLFGSLALVFSMFLPSARMASALSAALLVGNYLLVGMSGLNEDLVPIFEKTPLYFYQGAKIIDDPNWAWFGWMVGIALGVTLIAWLIFLKRDIRVGGEAGWQFSFRARQKAVRN
ncbi:ABC transporter permease [bacterium]|nr:ABC transporter permease [bacterium]